MEDKFKDLKICQMCKKYFKRKELREISLSEISKDIMKVLVCEPCLDHIHRFKD